MKNKLATVKVALLPFGRAAYRYQHEQRKAVKRGEFCQQMKITDRSGQYVENGEQCESLAKMIVDGKAVCGKHASFLMLQAAYKASR